MALRGPLAGLAGPVCELGGLPVVVCGGRRGEGCGDPLRKSRYCPSGTCSGGVDRRGPEEMVGGEGCDGSFGRDEVGIGVPTHLGNR